jgi:hypothetical protein
MLKTVIFAVVGALVPSVVIAQQDAKLNADNSVSAESKSAPFYGKDFDLRFNSRVPGVAACERSSIRTQHRQHCRPTMPLLVVGAERS